MSPLLLAGMSAEAAGSPAASRQRGASPGMCFEQRPTDGMVDTRELNWGCFALAVQTEISQVGSFLGKQLFWKKTSLLRSAFPAIQVSVENVHRPFLFQNDLPIKVIHICYLIEGNGHTTPGNIPTDGSS